MAEGLRYLWRHRLLRTLAAMTGLFNLATNATFAVFVLYAVGPDSAMGLTGSPTACCSPPWPPEASSAPSWPTPSSDASAAPGRCWWASSAAWAPSASWP